MNKFITASGQVDLELADPQTIGAVVFNLAISDGGSFSLTPQYKKSGASAYENVLYVLLPTGATSPAGTAITAAGTYEAPADSGLISLSVASVTGTLTVTYDCVMGASAGGGAASVVIANGGDVAMGSTTDAPYTDADGSSPGTVIALLKGIYINTLS